MHLSEQDLNGVLVVSPLAQRLDASVAGAFRERVFGFIQSGHNKLVLDLTEVQFMDSSGLTALDIGPQGRQPQGRQLGHIRSRCQP